MQSDGSRGRRWRAVTAWARRVRPVVVARVASALAFAKREFREQFPSDEEWARAVDEAREVAAFEEATNAARRGELAVRAGDDGVVDAGVALIVSSPSETVSRRAESVGTEAADARRAVDVESNQVEAGERDAGEVDAPSTPTRDDSVSSSRAALESPVKVRAVDADAATAESPRPETPARDDDAVASPSFDENDYVFDDDDEEEENIACVCVEPSVLVVPEALMRDRGALPDVDAVSFVPPERTDARTRLTGNVVKASPRRAYWRNTRRGARASPSRRFVVRASAPSTPSTRPKPKPRAPTPRAEIDADADVANATATADVITGHTPPWSFRRIAREPREFARPARTLLEWPPGAVDAPPDFVSAFAFTADVDATTTKLALTDEWFDVTDAGDIVLALTPSDVVAAEKRD